MNDDEIEEMISELRTLLDDNGFGWAREQAESTIEPGWHRRWLAQALLNTSENVTVDLACAELIIQEMLGTIDVSFEPDDGENPEGERFVPDERSVGSDPINRLRGRERQEALLKLASMREAFQTLKEQLSAPN